MQRYRLAAIVWGPIFAGCASVPATTLPASAADPSCALVVTDDDIPSGSATAGALYVEESEIGRALLTADVVAAARAFREAGIECVHALDSHDGAIDPKPLAEVGVSLLTPTTAKPWAWPFLGPMKAHYVAAALVGFHSNAGQAGFRPHTVNDWIKSLEVDGVIVGEVTQLVIGLGAFGVPVVLITGDMNAAHEGSVAAPGAATVAVRWLEPDGRPGFLQPQQAAQRIREGVLTALGGRPAPRVSNGPIKIAAQTYSRELMSDRASEIGATWAEAARDEGWDSSVLGGFDFSRASRDGDRLSWTAPNALSAFVSIAFACSYLQGHNAFEHVSRGYSAYKAGAYREALAAYDDALRVNPYDVATRCRMGAAHIGLGDFATAKDLFRYGVDRLDEVGDDALRSWCAVGLAEAEWKLGDVEAARHAAELVLSLPDFSRRHEKAEEILRLLNSLSR